MKALDQYAHSKHLQKNLFKVNKNDIRTKYQS